jgi:hypothetical protein
VDERGDGIPEEQDVDEEPDKELQEDAILSSQASRSLSLSEPGEDFAA